MLSVANSGDILTFYLPNDLKSDEDNPDDFYHYALIIKDCQQSKTIKVLYFDCALCESKISEFDEFYQNISSLGFNQLTYRKMFVRRDKVFYERQNEILNYDQKIINSKKEIKLARYLNLMQSIGSHPKCYWVNKIESYKVI